MTCQETRLKSRHVSIDMYGGGMSLTHALLGLLATRPQSGYELTKAFEGDLGRYAWQAGHTSIYPELAKLAERGLVEVTAEGARGSKTYDVTDAGRAELRDWLMSPPSRQAKVRNEQVLRMFLLSALDRDDAVTLLRRIAASTAEQADVLRAIREEAGDVVPGPAGFGQLAAEYGLRQYETVSSWALWAIEQLQTPART
ncbi:PadR family transcriptional regulator [Pseudonocardia dioxanivorans]|nr:PadR family transcriptional regulator [Pseudonocardia dioxanivorans]